MTCAIIIVIIVVNDIIVVNVVFIVNKTVLITVVLSQRCCWAGELYIVKLGMLDRC